MGKIYRTSWHNNHIMACIEVVNILKESEKTVTLESGHRVNKRSDWQNYFASFPEAKDFLLAQANIKMASLQQELRERGQAIEGLKTRVWKE